MYTALEYLERSEHPPLRSLYCLRCKKLELDCTAYWNDTTCGQCISAKTHCIPLEILFRLLQNSRPLPINEPIPYKWNGSQLSNHLIAKVTTESLKLPSAPDPRLTVLAYNRARIRAKSLAALQPPPTPPTPPPPPVKFEPPRQLMDCMPPDPTAPDPRRKRRDWYEEQEAISRIEVSLWDILSGKAEERRRKNAPWISFWFRPFWAKPKPRRRYGKRPRKRFEFDYDDRPTVY